MKPLLYLEIRQLINSIKNTTRTPKRLIPALIMGACIFSWFVRGLLLFVDNPTSSEAQLKMLQGVPIDLIKVGVFLFLSIGSVLVMYGAFSSGMMIFSISQIDFMFPTPISRRSVLLVKLIRDYLRYGLYVTVFFFFIGSPVFTGLQVNVVPWGFVSIIALTLLLVLVVNVSHTINIIFTFGFERLKQAGIIIKAVMIVGLASIVIYGLYQYAQSGSTYASILWAADSPVARFIFAPARWCSTLFLAPLLGVDFDDWVHLGMLAVLAAASFVLLLSRRENIYEPSLGVSAKHAARRAAMRTGDYTGVRVDALKEKGARRAGGITIPPFGRGAVALVWKSLLLRYRLSRGQILMMVVLPVVIVYVVKQFSATMEEIPKFMPAVLLYVVWSMSLIAPVEVRSELKQANILKSMPIPAWKVMLAQAINSTLYVIGGVFLFAVAMWVLMPGTRGEMLGACVLAVPGLAFANTSMATISALLYADSRDTAQTFLGSAIAMMLMWVVLIPTVVISAAMWIVFRASFYHMAIAVSLANFTIGAAGVSISGLLFRRFDPTGE
ncbi:MAG: putative ABC exporter domain-containing protein [Armatimonadetes bacterium]|nr:putative ABC exporter domain-containing protein [Armatimonadota bacterium]